MCGCVGSLVVMLACASTCLSSRQNARANSALYVLVRVHTSTSDECYVPWTFFNTYARARVRV